MTRSNEEPDTAAPATDARDIDPAVEAWGEVDAIARVVGVPPIPKGTPVIAKGGEVGEVLSHDPITGQVQIAFAKGGRGWYSAAAVEAGNVAR